MWRPGGRRRFFASPGLLHPATSGGGPLSGRQRPGKRVTPHPLSYRPVGLSVGAGAFLGPAGCRPPAPQAKLGSSAVAVAQLVELWLVVPVVAGSSPVCHPFKPGVCPIRQKFAFLPVHPDNRRISPHIGVRRRRTEAGAKPLAMRDSLSAAPEGGRIVVPAVAGSNPVCHPS